MRNGMLEIKDAPMFGRVMRNPDICKGVLERILGISVGHIEYLNTEQVFDPATDAKGVRMDVFAKDNNRVFNIEMQRADAVALGKRLRYYQASMDTAILDKGEDYDQLSESYVIFICMNDPCACSLPLYCFERTCKANPNAQIGDASHWIVVNASAWEQVEDASLAALLEYIFDGNVCEDDLVTKIDRAVLTVNADAIWRRNAMGFMTLEHHYRVQMRAATREGLEKGFEQGLQEGRRKGLEEGLQEGLQEGRTAGLQEGLQEGRAAGLQEGIQEGIQEGESRYAILVDKLLEQKRFDDLKRSADDTAFRQQLFEEFHLI